MINNKNQVNNYPDFFSPKYLLCFFLFNIIQIYVKNEHNKGTW